MFEKASLTDLRKRLKDLETARKADYLIPQPLVDSIKGEIMAREGIQEVWECDRCEQRMELMIRPKQVSCRCGKIRRVWKAPKMASS